MKTVIKTIKQEIEELKSQKIKQMEELLEIKSVKETQMKQLEQLQSHYIKEKAVLQSLKKQTGEERNKEEMYNQIMYKNRKCMNPIAKQPDGRSTHHQNYPTQTDLLKTVHPNYGKPSHFHKQVTKNPGEIIPNKPKYRTGSDLKDTQGYESLSQAHMQTQNHRDDRRRSLDIVQGMKYSQQYMSLEYRQEEMKRQETMRKQNFYTKNVSQNAAQNEECHISTKHNTIIDHSNVFSDMNSRFLSHQRRNSIHKFNIERGQFHHQQPRSLQEDAVCEACGKMANFTCSACKGVHYCTTECQVGSIEHGWLYNQNIGLQRDGWLVHSRSCRQNSGRSELYKQ